MFSAAKTIALGLVIGMSATALLAMAMFFSTTAIDRASISPSPALMIDPPSMTPTRVQLSPTPSMSPTFTAIPTLTLQPSPTTQSAASPTEAPDPIQPLIDSGGLIFSGPLSNAEQIALYRASLNYVQSTPEDSRRMAKQINGVGYGDPTNICGPLAIAILRDAGLLPPDIGPHDFWLLNPSASADQKLLAQTFPADRYAYSRTLTPLNKIDWQSAPLLPGDFLFIWHGSWGNFDHMLVVSRVDSNLRTYAVTNYGTPQGYVIAETLLYDPNDPTAGIFHTWTKERDAILGSTGFGGFELWRRQAH